MSSRLNPYISFQGNARAALEFYHEVFGGELTLRTFGEFGAADAPYANQIMHGMLSTASGYTIMGADAPPEMKKVTTGNNVVISLSGDSEGELRGYWEKLAKTGIVNTPLQVQVWGDEYGDLTDQFGVEWLVDIGPSSEATVNPPRMT